MIDAYRNLDIRLFNHVRAADGERFCVQVESSLAGGQGVPEEVCVPEDLAQQLAALDARRLGGQRSELIALGQRIGALLLPPVARSFFTSSLAKLAPNEGLRLRIKCSAIALDVVPWEFAYVERDLDGGGEALGLRGFLVGDSRVSVVRYEVCSQLAAPVQGRRAGWRLLAVPCEPEDRRMPGQPLQVDQELKNLRAAIAGVGGLEMLVCQPATREALQRVLLDGTEIFHFSGHGEVMTPAHGGAPSAHLILQRDDGASDPWEVDALARSLASKGIRLAVLAACQSARTDGRNKWAGVAPSLVRAGIPVVIGMQYSVYDASAVAFSKMLYLALSRVDTIDEAMAEARGAIMNLDLQTGRDFATPVLYMRIAEGHELGLRAALAGPAAAPAAVRAGSSSEVAIVLSEIAELHDHKVVHDALHSTRGDLTMIQLRRDEFPAGSSLAQFSAHCRDMKKRLLDVRRVAQQERCDAQLMLPLIEEFAAAVGTLEEALAQRSVDRLDDALAAFDTLLTVQPALIDTTMASLAKHLDLELLLAFLGGVGADFDAGAIEEIRALGLRLRKGATVHTLCQGLDNRLAVIRKAAEAQRFHEIRRQWRVLSDSIARMLPDWTSAGCADLGRHAELLGSGVAANDALSTCTAFGEFCDDFDYGFYTIDSDLKQLCGDMKDKVSGGRRA
ncbi:CHAT domain-containing protein [Rhizobacter sp. OV335]|uniref:CHAT domain-containing protein n=1 Tax=Rhizobacter sp. OV335 TaxID=1500264 RepID=UPI00091915AC|nr:CHAT domain-containing protein [Rhizobacter sp. OV335]SHN18623.1 CHAT domain-containing protein [Rhizobacter sp. OV335]